MLACISTLQLNSMQVEANESVSASHFRKKNPTYSNTSQSALGMNMDVIIKYSENILKWIFVQLDFAQHFILRVKIYRRNDVVLIFYSIFG